MRTLNGHDRSIVRLGKPDIKLGRPLLWNIYDEEGVLLYAKGGLIFSQLRLNELLERGIFRRLKNIPPDLQKLQEEEAQERKRRERKQAEDNRPFHKIPLSVGDVIQLEPLVELQTSERLTCRFVGYLQGKSVIVTTPIHEGKYVPLKEGQGYVIRVFSGRSVYAFVSHVLKQSHVHCSYAHFAYPNAVRGVRMRHNIRAQVDLICHIRTDEGAEAAARVHDLSAGGCRLVGREFIGAIGESILIKIRIRTDGLDEYVSIPAVIRSSNLATDKEGWVTHGVQFMEMEPEHKFALIAFVYRSLLLEESDS